MLISVIATVLLTFLGVSYEKIGLDKYLKTNTSKKITISLFRQGCIIFNRLYRMAQDTAIKLIDAFLDVINDSKELTGILGII